MDGRPHNVRETMENTTPFDLNAARARWQQDLAASPAFRGEDLEELASHLRASMQKVKSAGLSEAESFLIASRRLGSAHDLSREFGKLNRGRVWRTRSFWMLAGMLVYSLALDFSSLVSDAIEALSSLFLRNAILLGWISAAGWLAAIALAAFLFHRLATGHLVGITSSMARLLQRRKTAIAVLLGGIIASRVANAGAMILLVKIALRPDTARHFFAIKSYCSLFAEGAFIIVIPIALTKLASEITRAE